MKKISKRTSIDFPGICKEWQEEIWFVHGKNLVLERPISGFEILIRQVAGGDMIKVAERYDLSCAKI